MTCTEQEAHEPALKLAVESDFLFSFLVWLDTTLAWLGCWVFPSEMRVFSDGFAAAMSERAAHPLFEYQSCNFSNLKLFCANCVLLTD